MVSDQWCSIVSPGGLANVYFWQRLGAPHLPWTRASRGRGSVFGEAALTQSGGPMWQLRRSGPAQVVHLRPVCQGQLAETSLRDALTRVGSASEELRGGHRRGRVRGAHQGPPSGHL